MVHVSKIKTILFMEANRFFQNRKQVITTFLLGPVMVFLMLSAIGSISKNESRIEVYGSEAFREVITEEVENDEHIVFESGTVDHKARTSLGKNTVVIAVEQDTVQIYYDSSLLTDSGLLYTAQELADRIAAFQINEAQYPTYDETVRNISIMDISSSADQIEMVLIPLIGMVFIIALMLANMSISSLATDSIAGERERGTFDMLRLSGTGIRSIILGKYIFIVFVSMVILTADAAVLALGIHKYYPELFRSAAVLASENPLWFLPLLLCLFGIAALTAALYLALSASFEKVKQVGAYASIVQIVLSLFTYAPNVVDAQALNYLPISNLWFVLQYALAGESTIVFTASSMAIALAIAAASLCYATSILEKDTKQ